MRLPNETAKKEEAFLCVGPFDVKEDKRDNIKCSKDPENPAKKANRGESAGRKVLVLVLLEKGVWMEDCRTGGTPTLSRE